MLCSELLGECLLILSPRNRHRFKTHLSRKLHSEMTEAADPKHRDNIAASRATVSKRVERRDARTHKRRSIDRRQFVGNTRQRLCRRDHIFRVAAIERDAGRQQRHFTTEELPSPARITITTVATVPANTDSLPGFPRLHPLPHRIDNSDHLVSRHTWIFNSRPESFFD